MVIQFTLLLGQESVVPSVFFQNWSLDGRNRFWSCTGSGWNWGKHASAYYPAFNWDDTESDDKSEKCNKKEEEKHEYI